MLGNSKKEFENAVKLLTSLKDDPGNETKLQLYALYKQVKCLENYVCWFLDMLIKINFVTQGHYWKM